MNKESLSKIVAYDSITIVEAMAQIDANARGILFLTDEMGALCGCVTDGDIRRWILKGGDINQPIRYAMKINPKYLLKDEAWKAEAIMRQAVITAIPLLDLKRCIVDVLFLSEMSKDSFEKNKKSLKGTPVIVMAGGKGTRLYPYTKILPKPLIPIGETPIVERIINEFVSFGIEQFYMTVHYKKAMIKSYFSEIVKNYQINYIEEDQPLGTCGSIKLIKEKFEKPIFVINSDALILADYADVYNHHIQSENDITIVAALKNMTISYGVLNSGKNGELLSIEEKPSLSYFINTGMYIVNPQMIEKIPENVVFHMTDLVETVMKSGGKVGTYPISEDSYLDMGEFSEMKRMEEKLNIVSEEK